MDLLQVLNKKIPPKRKILALSKKKQPQDVSKFLHTSLKGMRKGITDPRIINCCIIEMYDVLYHDIMFDRIFVRRKLLKMIEALALPIAYVGEKQWREQYRKLCKLKK